MGPSLSVKDSTDQRFVRYQDLREKAQEEGQRLVNFRMSQRVQLEKARRKDKMDQLERMQVDKKSREQRWTQKLAGHPFAVDQWSEDVRIYDRNRARDSEEQQRRRKAYQKEIEERGAKIKQNCEEVDDMEEKRKERKRLIDEQKVLKIRLDIERKTRRAVVQGTTPAETPIDTPAGNSMRHLADEVSATAIDNAIVGHSMQS